MQVSVPDIVQSFSKVHLINTEYFQNAFFHGKGVKGRNTAVENDSNDDLACFILSYFKIQILLLPKGMVIKSIWLIVIRFTITKDNKECKSCNLLTQ